MKQLIPYAFQVSSHVAPSFTARLATDLFLKPKRHPQSQREIDLLHSARVETLQSGRKVYFWGQGPIVTFVHGWESRGSAFHKWIPHFVESGFQVMGWDGPAHGGSPGTHTHAPEIAKSLRADILELGISVHALVGHSLGGVVVGILSELMPLPPKVVILSAPAHVSTVFERFQNQIRLSLNARKKFNDRIQRLTGFNLSEVSLANQNLSLKTQTLLIHDIHDREVPFADFEMLQKAWPQSRSIATSGLGHRRILRDESVAHQIIDFLKI